MSSERFCGDEEIGRRSEAGVCVLHFPVFNSRWSAGCLEKKWVKHIKYIYNTQDFSPD